MNSENSVSEFFFIQTDTSPAHYLTAIVCVKPDFSRRVLSKDQEAHHERFRATAAYAQQASLRQPIYAKLATGTVKNAYNLALGDWFHPPVILRIEKGGWKNTRPSQLRCVRGKSARDDPG